MTVADVPSTDEHAARAALGIPPRPLSAADVASLVAQLPAARGNRARALVQQLAARVPPGVDDAARAKAAFLAGVARGELACAALHPAAAVELLGGMGGGYNVAVLVALLDHRSLGSLAAEQLADTVLVHDAFHEVAARAAAGVVPATRVLEAWAAARWFTAEPPFPDRLSLTVVRVDGEINTDMFSPATEAWSRPDIPRHALSLLATHPQGADVVATCRAVRSAGGRVAFVGDVIGTGSSRKSAVNSLLWHIGDDIAGVPNKRRGGVVLGGAIAPIFAGTLRDAGAFAAVGDVRSLRHGDEIVLHPAGGRIEDTAGAPLTEVELLAPAQLDEVRAGGRTRLLIGRSLSDRAAALLGGVPSAAFTRPAAPLGAARYTLAQKIVGRACGLDGIAPGTSCEPVVSTVGSQDTTGPMNRAELEELACTGFAADLVLQSFCHTAAYPKPVDIRTQRTLPSFMAERGAVVLRPGDGIIHSWLNRMLLPDQVGTGSDSHTRFPLGLSFPGGSGLVAFAAALGVMPLDMPPSVLVRFSGTPRPGMTVRDLVHAVPYAARQQGLLTLEASSKRNVFSGHILEIEGLEQLAVEQAFELTDASAERSAAACTIALSEESVVTYLRSNVALLRRLIEDGYEDRRTLARRADAIERWLREPALLRADPGAAYAAVVEVDLDELDEPLLACPNDPDDVRLLSAVAGRAVDEVFIGSCMTNIGHFRAAAALLAEGGEAAAARLWLAPPTAMDADQLRQEGHYGSYAAAGARVELPGCSLCMGNQARVRPGATVVSTSTRNFPNRLGDGADVYLASAEVAALSAVLGRLPTVEEYRARTAGLASDLGRPLQFDHIGDDDATFGAGRVQGGVGGHLA